LSALRPKSDSAAIPFLIYAAISIALFGGLVLDDFGSSSIGYGADPTIFIWSLEWWPHAFLNGLDPINSGVLYAPDGFNLTWATTMPIVVLVLSPITAVIGQIAAYNLLAILIPALNGWAAFLLCRALGAGFWPSVAGGYLFGFSSYVVGQSLGHANLSLVAAIPFAAFLVVEHLKGRLANRGFIAALAATLSFQFLTSTEVFLTFTAFGLAMLALGRVVNSGQRDQLFGMAKRILAAYAIAGLIVSPYLYAFLTDPPSITHANPYDYSADPVNLVVPTQLPLVGGQTFKPVSDHFSGNIAENGTYLGLPLLLVVILFVKRRPRTPEATMSLVLLGVATVAALGPRLNILRDQTAIPLPWSALVDLPLFQYVLPVRLMVYAWLAVAIIVALWLSTQSQRNWGRWALVGLIAATLIPNIWLRGDAENIRLWVTDRPVPEFFRDARLRQGLGTDPNLLVLPYNGASNGNTLVWQAEAGMSFSMPGGYITATIPDEFACWPIVGSLHTAYYRRDQVGYLRSFVRAKEVDAIVVPVEDASPLEPLLGAFRTTRRRRGDVYIYELPQTDSDRAKACPS
jgi:hypothetical protein